MNPFPFDWQAGGTCRRREVGSAAKTNLEDVHLFMRLKCSSAGPARARAAHSNGPAGRGVLAVLLLAGMWFAGGVFSASAQWLTQPLVIKPGWTAVYLNVDASSQNLDQLVGYDPTDPIDQIWLWRVPASTAQYISDPAAQLSDGSHWITWMRNSPATPTTLGALVPNSAYLIHSTASTNFTWRVQGQPVPPSYAWDLTGLNFIGFSTPSVNPPNFQNYLAPDPAIAGIVQLYQYIGGNLNANNPQPVFSQYLTKVTRGQAFWVSATNVNNSYFGPFKVSLLNPAGINFGAGSGQTTFHLQNVTANPLTVTMRLLASEAPPYGQTNIVGAPPLLVEGAQNPANLSYAYTALATNNSASGTNSYSWTLAPAGQPGSDVAVVLGVNRFALTGPGGLLYAGTLQFTDSLGFSEIDVPVSAQSQTTAGLWVGSASITQVGSYLKSYATNEDGSLLVSSNGAFVITGVNTNLGAVVTPYPLRLIIFNDGTNASLLQRVYYGIRGGTNLVVATTESVLDQAQLGVARRITSTQMPWMATNTPWAFNGPLTLGGTITTTVTDAFDDQAANPFLHTFHPDHNNLTPIISPTVPPHELLAGSESYNIQRTITLSFVTGGNDFVSLTSSASSLAGSYQEAISLIGLGGFPRNFNTAGSFTLTRISPIATLTTQ